MFSVKTLLLSLLLTLALGVSAFGDGSEVIHPGTPINLTLTSADTEYSTSLPAGCAHFSFQCRTAFDVRFAFVTGKVAGSTAPYLTLKSGNAFSSPEKLSLKPGFETIYFASSQAGVVVEVVPWTSQ